MVVVMLFFVHALVATLTADMYREPLFKSFVDAKSLQEPSLWISSVDYLKEQLVSPHAAPGVVCITHSSLEQTTELSTLLQGAQKVLGKKAQVFCVDVKDESLQPFVMQVKDQLGLRHLPLPAFVFFNRSAIVLPIQAGITSSDELVRMTYRRFNIPESKEVSAKKDRVVSSQKRSQRMSKKI